MSVMKIFAGIYDSPTQEHRNEHTLPGTEVGHIGLLKEVAESVIRQDFFVEQLRGSPDCVPSAD
jgi:hypothetical protein